MSQNKPRFDPHALDRMDQRRISETDVLRVIARGIRSPTESDTGAAPRFAYRGFIDGRWIEVVVAMEEPTMLIVTVMLKER